MPATQTTIKILFNSQSVIAVTTTLNSVKVVSTNKMTTTQVSDIKIMTLDTVRVPSIMPKILMQSTMIKSLTMILMHTAKKMMSKSSTLIPRMWYTQTKVPSFMSMNTGNLILVVTLKKESSVQLLLWKQTKMLKAILMTHPSTLRTFTCQDQVSLRLLCAPLRALHPFLTFPRMIPFSLIWTADSPRSLILSTINMHLLIHLSDNRIILSATEDMVQDMVEDMTLASLINYSILADIMSQNDPITTQGIREEARPEINHTIHQIRTDHRVGHPIPDEAAHQEVCIPLTTISAIDSPSLDSSPLLAPQAIIVVATVSKTKTTFHLSMAQQTKVISKATADSVCQTNRIGLQVV